MTLGRSFEWLDALAMSLTVLVTLLELVGRNKKINRVIGARQFKLLGQTVVGMGLLPTVLEIEILEMLCVHIQEPAVLALIGTTTVVFSSPVVFKLFKVNIVGMTGLMGT